MSPGPGRFATTYCLGISFDSLLGPFPCFADHVRFPFRELFKHFTNADCLFRLSDAYLN